MFLKSYHADDRWHRLSWNILRPFVSRRRRWYYEGCRAIAGQLWVADRQLLDETIRRVRPRTVCEVGTWHGGGSTLFIAQALYEIGGGHLHTVEADSALHGAAVESYRQHCSHLLPFVTFYQGLSTEVYPTVLPQLGKVDVLFLDGADDPQRAVREFRMFEPFLAPTAVLIAHDWDDEKMFALRPRIDSAPDWKINVHLTPPVSVGMVACSRSQPDL